MFGKGWQPLIDILRLEHQARLADPPAAEALACRLAFLLWDSGAPLEEVQRWVPAPGARSQAARELQRQLALALGDAQGAARALVQQASELEPDEACLLRYEAALLQAFWAQDFVAALEALRGISADRLGEAPLLELHVLLHALVGDHPRLVQLCREAPDEALPLKVLAAVVLWDREGAAAAALELLQPIFAADESDLFVLELMVELFTALDREQELCTFLARKMQLLSQKQRNPESMAIALEVVQLLSHQGRESEAADLLDLLDPPPDCLPATEQEGSTDPLFVTPLLWGESLLLFSRRRLAVRTRRFSQAATAYLRLADSSGVPAMARAYRRRGAQLLVAAEESNERPVQLLAQNLAETVNDRGVLLDYEILQLKLRQVTPLCAAYEKVAAGITHGKESLLRRAALLAEGPLAQPALAASLLRDALAMAPSLVGLGDLQRLARASHSDARLVEAYRRAAKQGKDPALAALFWALAAAIHLQLEQPAEAEAAAQEALARSPGDLLALGILCRCYLAGQRAKLAQLLRDKLEVVKAEHTRCLWHAKLAELVEAPEEQVAHLEAARLLTPETTELANRLLELCVAGKRYEDAVHWGLLIAAKLEADPLQAAEVYLRVGLLCRFQLGDWERAVSSLRRANELNPSSVEVLQVLVDTQRAHGSGEELADTLQRLAELGGEGKQRSSLLLEVASMLASLPDQTDAAIDGYARSLEADPQCAEALAQLVAHCRRRARLPWLADLLRGLPPAAALQEQLCALLEELGDLQAVSAARAQLVELAAGPLERADRIYEHARVLERLDQQELAMTRYLQVIAEVPGHQPALRAAQRIYRGEGRTAALALLLEQELDAGPSQERRVEILLELAPCLEALGQLARAIERLEQAVALDPANYVALVLLERFYSTQNSPDLARILLQLGAAHPEEDERAALFLRAGEVASKSGNQQLALAAYRRALAQDPGNRDAFSRCETVLYGQQDWQGLMDVYAQAISYAEVDGGRSYLPADLYLRRGLLQLERLGQPAEAAASYLKALDHDPKNDATMKMLETIFLQQEDWLGLVQAYAHRATLLPDDELFRLESLRQAARLARGRLPGEQSLVLALWQEIHSIDPIDEEAIEALEQLYTRLGDLDRLADLLQTKVVLATDETEALELSLRVATICEVELEDLDRAVEAYEAIRQRHPHHELTLQSLSRIYEGTGQWPLCLEVLKDLVIIEADPSERALHYFKCGSIAESRFRDDEAAIGYYRAALNETSGCLPALHGLRDLYLRRQEWHKALETLDREFRLWDEPREQAGIMARMGEIRLLHLNDQPKAIEHFEDALAIDPDCQVATVALFNFSFEHGENAKALELSTCLARRLAKEGALEERSQFFSRQGQLLVASGRFEEAAESLVYALEIKPTNLEALDWLISLCRNSPESYDFADIFRDLEQVYRREGNQAAVGHVLLAAGALSEIAGDAEIAISRYQEAIAAAPQDLAPAKALADLQLRLRQQEDAGATLQALIQRAENPALQIQGLLYLAEIAACTATLSVDAAALYRTILAQDPGQRPALEGLAQELYLQGRFQEALQLMHHLDETALQDAIPRRRELSRYAHYLGAILLKLGEQAAAHEQLQRALQLDGTNARAAMTMARQLVLMGQREQARQLLERCIWVTSKAKRGPTAELVRSIVGICLGSGEIETATAYLDQLVGEGQAIEDRLALAEVYAVEDASLPQAIEELQQVLSRDGTNLHALNLLADLLERSGRKELVANVVQVMHALGWEHPRHPFSVAAAEAPFLLPMAALDEQSRLELQPALLDSHIERLWGEVRQPLEQLFKHEFQGQQPQSAEQSALPGLQRAADICRTLFEQRYQIEVAREVPGGVTAGSDAGGGTVTLDVGLASRPCAEVTFTLARTLYYLSGGQALLSRLAFDDRLLLGELLGGLLQPLAEQNDLVREFRQGLARRVIRRIDDVILSYQDYLSHGGEAEQPARWLGRVDRAANNCGLLACDRISSALRILAQLSGQELALGVNGQLAPQLVLDGPELVQFFISETYIKLRQTLFPVELLQRSG